MSELTTPFKAACALFDELKNTGADVNDALVKEKIINLLSSGHLVGYFLNEQGQEPVPAWAWQGMEDDGYLWIENCLPLNPRLPDEWFKFSFCQVRVPIHGWTDLLIGKQPSLPPMPKLITKREPPTDAYISLSSAVSWLAFGLSMDNVHLEWAIDRNLFEASKQAVDSAIQRLCDAALGQAIELHGRREKDHAMEAIPCHFLHDNKAFDVHINGLLAGNGWARDQEGSLKADHGARFLDVAVNRQQLLGKFKSGSFDKPNETTATRIRFKKWLPTELKNHDPTRTSKKDIMSIANHNFPELSVRGFNQGWKEADMDPRWKKVGRKSAQ